MTEHTDGNPTTSDAFAQHLPVRQLSEFTYCPRLFHLMHIEGRWEDNEFTIDGRNAHRRVDQLDHVLPDVEASEQSDDVDSRADDDPAPVVLRSVQLTSDQLGIVGKLDLVSLADGQAVPVETKRGRVPDNAERSWEPERVQVMAQGLLLREHGYACDHGVLYFRGSRTRVDIPFTGELEAHTRQLIADAQRACSANALPQPLENSPKCDGCSLSGICLPDETLEMRSERETPTEPRRLFPVRDETVPLYVQEQGARIGKRGESLLVKMRDDILATVRTKDVSQLVLCGNIGISAQATRMLCEKNIPILHMSRGHWFYGMTSGEGLRNAYDREAQFRAAADPDRSLEFARALVCAKINNQRTMLRRNGAAIDDRVLAALKAHGRHAKAAAAQDQLLGFEGAAAREYFARFSTMIRSTSTDPEFDFEGRNRRPPRDPINALLSFAYAMLAKELAVAIRAEGLDPWWGLFHKPRHGRPALALDLMEEFRPLVADSAVLTAVNTRMLTDRGFERSRAGCAMKPAARKAMVRAFASRLDQLVTHPVFGYRCSWRSTIRLQCRMFSRWLRGDVPAYVGMVTR